MAKYFWKQTSDGFISRLGSLKTGTGTCAGAIKKLNHKGGTKWKKFTGDVAALKKSAETVYKKCASNKETSKDVESVRKAISALRKSALDYGWKAGKESDSNLQARMALAQEVFNQVRAYGDSYIGGMRAGPR